MQGKYRQRPSDLRFETDSFRIEMKKGGKSPSMTVKWVNGGIKEERPDMGLRVRKEKPNIGKVGWGARIPKTILAGRGVRPGGVCGRNLLFRIL